MKNFTALIYIEIFIGFIGFLLLVISYLNMSYILTFIGIFVILVSILLYFLTKTAEMFKKDKELDIESLKKQGFTIISCQNCGKSNVLEDKYCIFCGEDLKNVN